MSLFLPLSAQKFAELYLFVAKRQTHRRKLQIFVQIFVRLPNNIAPPLCIFIAVRHTFRHRFSLGARFPKMTIFHSKERLRRPPIVSMKTSQECQCSTPKKVNEKIPRKSMVNSQEFQFEAKMQVFAARFARSLSLFVDACRLLSKCETGKEYRCAWMSVLFLSGFVTVCRGEQSSVPSLRTLLDRVLSMFVFLCRCLSAVDSVSHKTPPI